MRWPRSVPPPPWLAQPDRSAPPKTEVSGGSVGEGRGEGAGGGDDGESDLPFI